MINEVVVTTGWREFQKKVFLRRARGHARLVHPQIQRLFDIHVQGDGFSLWSEPTVSHLGQRWESIDRERFVQELLRSLDFAHTNGIVHGCLCPENLRFSQDGELKVWGFGFDWYERASYALDEGFVPGHSFNYVAPENLCGLKKDGRADLYSFGLLLYRSWGREISFDDSLTINNKVSELLRGPQLSLEDLPEAVASMVKACTERDPTERPNSVRDVMKALGVPRERTSTSLKTQTTLARSIIDSEHWEGLREVLMEALSFEPDSASVLNDLGAAALWTGHISESQGFLRIACDRGPQKAQCHFNLGLTYLRTNERQLAAEAFQRAISLDDQFGRAHLELGKVLLELDQTQDALGSAQRAAELLPSYGDPFIVLSELLHATDEKRAAEYRWMATKLENLPDIPETMSA